MGRIEEEEGERNESKGKWKKQDVNSSMNSSMNQWKNQRKIQPGNDLRIEIGKGGRERETERDHSQNGDAEEEEEEEEVQRKEMKKGNDREQGKRKGKETAEKSNRRRDLCLAIKGGGKEEKRDRFWNRSDGTDSGS